MTMKFTSSAQNAYGGHLSDKDIGGVGRDVKCIDVANWIWHKTLLFVEKGRGAHVRIPASAVHAIVSCCEVSMHISQLLRYIYEPNIFRNFSIESSFVPYYQILGKMILFS